MRWSTPSGELNILEEVPDHEAGQPFVVDEAGADTAGELTER